MIVGGSATRSSRSSRVRSSTALIRLVWFSTRTPEMCTSPRADLHETWTRLVTWTCLIRASCSQVLFRYCVGGDPGSTSTSGGTTSANDLPFYRAGPLEFTPDAEGGPVRIRPLHSSDLRQHCPRLHDFEDRGHRRIRGPVTCPDGETIAANAYAAAAPPGDPAGQAGPLPSFGVGCEAMKLRAGAEQCLPDVDEGVHVVGP